MRWRRFRGLEFALKKRVECAARKISQPESVQARFAQHGEKFTKRLCFSQTFIEWVLLRCNKTSGIAAHSFFLFLKEHSC